jgi:hypothetical protein
MMIRREDLETRGYSANCLGCKAILRGTARQGHSENCRKRLEEALKDDPRVKLQRLKEKEYVHKRLEEQERKRSRREEAREEEKDEGMQVERQAPALEEAPSRSRDPWMYVH